MILALIPWLAFHYYIFEFIFYYYTFVCVFRSSAIFVAVRTSETMRYRNMANMAHLLWSRLLSHHYLMISLSLTFKMRHNTKCIFVFAFRSSATFVAVRTSENMRYQNVASGMAYPAQHRMKFSASCKSRKILSNRGCLLNMPIWFHHIYCTVKCLRTVVLSYVFNLVVACRFTMNHVTYGIMYATIITSILRRNWQIYFLNRSNS